MKTVFQGYNSHLETVVLNYTGLYCLKVKVIKSLDWAFFSNCGDHIFHVGWVYLLFSLGRGHIFPVGWAYLPGRPGLSLASLPKSGPVTIQSQPHPPTHQTSRLMQSSRDENFQTTKVGAPPIRLQFFSVLNIQ